MAKARDTKTKTRIQREKTEEILAAALDIFSSAGFRGASINEISKRAGMSTPSLLYYFQSKEHIHRELLSRTLLVWLGPLNLMKDSDDPVEEICTYVRRKLEISEQFPRESRLFANEILMGIPRAEQSQFDPLRSIFDAKIALIESWVRDGRIAPVDPHHLMYSIWATTQHYADFESQIKELSPEKMGTLFRDAETHLVAMYRTMLVPNGPEASE
ncbi:MAG: TetR family transcriptional regulator C-terminal domain-containing protein [Rhodobacteraceae bacterium]|nr:TetR family transcriptional regulator C-terminal domain-containing protein [Paracoccaceae bacterium]